MSATREGCIRQLKRLAVAPALLPQSREGKDELVRVFMRAARSDEHAERIMDSLIENARDCKNVAAELTALARTVSEGDAPALPPPCRTCEGTDFIPVERRGYSTVGRCTCARGRRLAELDARRRASEEPTVRAGGFERIAPDDFKTRATGEHE